MSTTTTTTTALSDDLDPPPPYEPPPTEVKDDAAEEDNDDWEDDDEGDDGWGDDDDDADFMDDGGGDDGWGDLKEDDGLPPENPGIPTRAVSYIFVDDKVISERKEDAILRAMEQLDVTHEEAGCILRAYFWDIDKATEAWYEDRDTVRKKIGVSAPLTPSGLPHEVQCETFMCDEVPRSQAQALGCGHWFCDDCWKQHCMAVLEEGAGSIYATCPGFNCTKKKKKCKHTSSDNCKCQELMPEDFFYKYVTDKKALAKYGKYMRDAFVEKNKQIKWCPKPGCEYCVEYEAGTERDIKCKCGHVFCFACGLDAHLPVPCDLATKFLQLETGDALTEALLRAITKPCPGCKVLIQKNEACIHMTCKKCRHEFCWLCKKNWKGHGGGYYSCKKYNNDKAKGQLGEEAKTLMKNQAMMQKYNTYSVEYNKYKREANAVAAILKQFDENEDVEKFKFLVDALGNLVSGYRCLQWSYCLTYFLTAGKVKRLFLFQQKELAKIVGAQKKLYGDGTKLSSDLLKLRKEIIGGSRQITNIVKGCNDQVGDMIEAIQSEADTENDQWTCMVCNNIMESQSIKKCTKCNACQEHGEKTCWACNPRK